MNRYQIVARIKALAEQLRRDRDQELNGMFARNRSNGIRDEVITALEQIEREVSGKDAFKTFVSN